MASLQRQRENHQRLSGQMAGGLKQREWGLGRLISGIFYRLVILITMFEKTIRKIKVIYHHFMTTALENHLEPKSVFHLKKLVSLNDDWGLNHLGCRYVAGKGVEQDFRMAYECFDRSVSLQGKTIMYAEANIGSLYMNGQYLPLDEKKAAEWFGKAAQKGFPIAQYNYGLALIDGWMGYTSQEEGIKWLKKAEASGLAEASEVLAKLSGI